MTLTPAETQQRQRAAVQHQQHMRALRDLSCDMREFLSIKYPQLLAAEVANPVIELMKCFVDEFGVSMGEANRLVTAWANQ